MRPPIDRPVDRSRLNSIRSNSIQSDRRSSRFSFYSFSRRLTISSPSCPSNPQRVGLGWARLRLGGGVGRVRLTGHHDTRTHNWAYIRHNTTQHDTSSPGASWRYTHKGPAVGARSNVYRKTTHIIETHIDKERPRRRHCGKGRALETGCIK